jgi:hypothetical protein
VGDLVVVDGADKLKDGAKVLLRQPNAPSSASTPATHTHGSGQGGHRHQQQQQQQQSAPGN